MINEVRPNYDMAIETGEGIYWVGYNYRTIFHTNPYLIVDGDEAVLIDPGSSIDFFAVRAKVAQIIPISKIRHIVLHHQDPDLCGSTRQFEIAIGHDIAVYNPERSSFFAHFYGIKTPVTKISEDGHKLKFGNGRILRFYMTPYCHAPGAMITYDEKTKTVFTSDIFGAFNQKWELYHDWVGEEKHLETMKMFMEPYMGSKEAILSVADKLAALQIKTICPQHGSIIRSNIPEWIGALKKMEYGKALGEQVKWWR
ncbi:MAG: MBL fold metallo-hydrolase [Parcubacteria group bacterium]|nr:MBL fold metallo-hydrolase [Parcubacteria group bacterium]